MVDMIIRYPLIAKPFQAERKKYRGNKYDPDVLIQWCEFILKIVADMAKEPVVMFFAECLIVQVYFLWEKK
jgi:hypothetical protein